MGKNRAKVVHLTSVHPPFDTRIFEKECRSLAEAGYDTVLVAPHEKPEVVRGVRIRPVPHGSSRWNRVTRVTRAVYRAALEEDGDLYHFHDPELLPAGLALKRLGKRVVYDVHEDMPRNILSKYWIPRATRRPISYLTESLEGRAARVLDAIVAATPPIARRFSSGRTVTVMNFPRLEENELVEPLDYESRPLEFAYVGSLSAVRGAREMVQAIGALSGHPSARLVIAGRFYPPALADELAACPGWDRTDALGWCERSQLAGVLNRARAGLATLHPTESFVESYPTKLFEYMSFGVPVIASDFPIWRNIVLGAGAGLVVDPTSPEAIADALAWILEHPREAAEMGKRGRAAAYAKYDWTSQARILLALYEELLGST
ncbi:MAG: glycosyltransferase family 4 protein [Gemmatimonadota bacterium]